MIEKVKTILGARLKSNRWYLIFAFLFWALFSYIASKYKISLFVKTFLAPEYSIIYYIWFFQAIFILALPDAVKNKVLRNIVNILWLLIMIVIYVILAIVLYNIPWYGPIWCTNENFPLIIVVGLTLLIYGLGLLYKWCYNYNFKSKYNLIIALLSVGLPVTCGYYIHTQLGYNSYQNALLQEYMYLGRRLGSFQGVKDYIYEYDLWCLNIDECLNDCTNDEKRNFYIEFKDGKVNFSTSKSREEEDDPLARNIKTYDYKITIKHQEYVVEWTTRNAKYTFNPRNR
ncbi:MAG: hypothetical protein K2H60_11740, partial [Muribaculaceae bacterium]|nr:hypothetical protein [Muribaculaceae bacterium]